MNSHNYYSFHTFEFSKRLGYREYQEIKNMLYADAERQKYRMYPDRNNPNITHCHKYQNLGVEIQLKRKKTFCHLLLIINPRRIESDEEYLEIFKISEDNVDKFLLILQQIVSFLDIGSYDDLKMKRQDLCYNLLLESREEVVDYITLIQRARTIYPLKKAFYIDGIKRTEDSVSFGCEDYELYIYDKGAERSKEALIVDIANIPNIIRFELRLKRDKIKRVYKEIQRMPLREILCQASDISKTQFNDYIPKIFLMGEYNFIEAGREIIRDSKFASKTKEKMIAILEEAAKRQDLQIALEEIYAQCQPYKIGSILRNFNELNLNPMPLPRRRTCNKDALPSVPFLLELMNETE